MDQRKVKGIENIFGCCFEEPEDNFLEETIRKIEGYGAKYDPNCFGGNAEDQLLACEAVAEATPVRERDSQEDANTNVSVNGIVNGSCEPKTNFELTKGKLQAITKLKECDYRTSRFIIAKLLEEVFREYKSQPGHWLYIAQNWTPKSINSAISYTVKVHLSGCITLQNPAAYFTKIVKWHHKRKVIIVTNGSRKQQI